MNPRELYETADRLLDAWELTGHPQLLAEAERHAAAAEHHLLACPNHCVEDPWCLTR